MVLVHDLCVNSPLIFTVVDLCMVGNQPRSLCNVCPCVANVYTCGCCQDDDMCLAHNGLLLFDYNYLFSVHIRNL